MSLAALIIATLGLILGIINLSVMLAKNFFSTHVVQLQPLDSMIPPAPGNARPMTEPYKEIGEDLTNEELEYFERLKAAKR